MSSLRCAPQHARHHPSSCIAASIGREITMSALREWAATMGGAARDAVAVNSLGKWKTASQVGGRLGSSV